MRSSIAISKQLFPLIEKKVDTIASTLINRNKLLHEKSSDNVKFPNQEKASCFHPIVDIAGREMYTLIVTDCETLIIRMEKLRKKTQMNMKKNFPYISNKI